ncbi:hypothetical protein [Accumulibacter sp.]|uniref:hypothetical protein n=1 Tax=Accumulibacter sp. TaxID=2053492 RepID=UPI0025CC65C8|nr:hypothetical protein [Accumulibacter sp.]MCM8596441.1 hypothetical protein [Accumulibacter sp.]MCM8627084.1 hypothetical protein [Accumulibacter sp.]MDS4050590.1 hypothetical protein [Accumulibacter sp.]
MFPLGGNRCVACGVERVLGVPFGFLSSAHRFVLGGQRDEVVGGVGGTLAGHGFHGQESILVGLQGLRW